MKNREPREESYLVKLLSDAMITNLTQSDEELDQLDDRNFQHSLEVPRIKVEEEHEEAGPTKLKPSELE